MWTKSAPLAVSCLASGIFWDVDHIADFLAFSGEKISLSGFFSWCDDARWKRVTLLLHSYELYIAGAALALLRLPAEPVSHGILIGAGLHLAMDQMGNRRQPDGKLLHPCFYFLTFRLLSGFSRDKMVTSPQ